MRYVLIILVLILIAFTGIAKVNSSAVSSTDDSWTYFSLSNSHNSSIWPFNFPKSNGFPIEVDINIKNIQNAELGLVTQRAQSSPYIYVYYNKVGIFSYSNSTTLLNFVINVSGIYSTNTDHNSSVSFSYRLKSPSTSTSIPTSIILNVWKNVTLYSNGPYYINIFSANTEHNLTLNIQLTKIVHGSLSASFFQSDTGSGETINDLQNHSFSQVGHYVTLDMNAEADYSIIEGRYQLIDNGSVGPIAGPGFELLPVAGVILFLYFRKKKF